MNSMMVDNALQNISEEESFAVNGGVVPEVAAALIAAAVAVIGGYVAMDMQNAVEQGRNDAYNDIYKNGSNGGVIKL